MKKKTKQFTTVLLATALLSNGFTLKTTAKSQQEEQAPTEVCVTTSETEPQHLVVSEPTKRKTGHPSPHKATVSPSELPEEETPLGDSKEQTQDPKTTFDELGEQTPDSQSQDQAPPKSGKHHTKTGQPSPENAPTSHGKPPREQPSPLTEELNTAEQETQQPEDILQKILNNTYEFSGDEVIYTETAIIYITFPTQEELQPVYVNGFGWVETSKEPSIRIGALDLYESGVKVSIMGG